MMYRKRRPFWLAVLLLSWSSWLPADTTTAPAPPKTASILLLLAYEPLHPAAQSLVQALSGQLRQQVKQPLQLHVEYMDSDLLNSSTYLQQFGNLLHSKQQQGERYDLAIVAGNSALQLAAQEQQRVLAGTPVVFMNVSDTALIRRLLPGGNLTGVPELPFVYEFLALCRSLFPGLQNLHVITDGRSGQRDHLPLLQQATDSLNKTLQVHSLADLSWDELAARLQTMRDQPILLLSASQDRLGQPKSFRDAISFLSEQSASPLWHLWPQGIGDGLTGGVVSDHQQAAHQVATMANRILQGARAAELPVHWQLTPVILADVRQLARFGISISELPASARLLHQRPGFWSRYGWVLLLMVVASGLTGLVLFLVWSESRRRQLSDEQLRDRTRLIRNILDSIPDLIFYKDCDGRYVFCNKPFVRVMGTNPVGKTDYDAFDQQTAEFFRSKDSEAMARKNMNANEEWVHSADGRMLLLETQKTPIYDRKGQLIGVFGLSRDITDLKKTQQNLEHIAHHDALTNLPNRLLLNKKLEYALNLARRNEEQLGILYLDLDRFKDINDTIGHDIGDLLLKDVAHRLHNNIRDTDICSRLGGDEFIVVLTSVNDAQRIQEKCEQLLQLIAQPYSLQGHLLSVFASAGISVFPQDGNSVDELIRNADAALHKAKELGRNRCYHYERELTDSIHSRMSLEQDLRSAMESRQFTLAFQPQFKLGTAKPQRAEALLRWPHPARGMISPLEFIPLAETSGMIIELGYWVLRSTCQQFLFWREQGLMLEKIAVNVSPVQINSSFANTVTDILQQLNFDPHWLELEVTEGLMMSGTTEVSQQIEQLRALGVEFSIDDFGTGYSSLSKLKSMPVSVLKIDQSFVRDINDDINDFEIVRAIVAMASSLGLTVVAEGVETAAHESTLQELGCEWMQGYYYAKPMAADEFYQRYRNTPDA